MHLIHREIINKKYKENLLNSFKQSFKKGFGIETDIHATKDNKFICYHDFTLTRIFKKKQSVRNLNYQMTKNNSKFGTLASKILEYLNLLLLLIRSHWIILKGGSIINKY